MSPLVTPLWMDTVGQITAMPLPRIGQALFNSSQHDFQDAFTLERWAGRLNNLYNTDSTEHDTA